jgi:hypothetical protein
MTFSSHTWSGSYHKAHSFQTFNEAGLRMLQNRALRMTFELKGEDATGGGTKLQNLLRTLIIYILRQLLLE